jgi:hypothetical protein
MMVMTWNRFMLSRAPCGSINGTSSSSKNQDTVSAERALAVVEQHPQHQMAS